MEGDITHHFGTLETILVNGYRRHLVTETPFYRFHTHFRVLYIQHTTLGSDRENNYPGPADISKWLLGVFYHIILLKLGDGCFGVKLCFRSIY